MEGNFKKSVEEINAETSQANLKSIEQGARRDVEDRKYLRDVLGE